MYITSELADVIIKLAVDVAQNFLHHWNETKVWLFFFMAENQSAYPQKRDSITELSCKDYNSGKRGALITFKSSWYHPHMLLRGKEWKRVERVDQHLFPKYLARISQRHCLSVWRRVTWKHRLAVWGPGRLQQQSVITFPWSTAQTLGFHGNTAAVDVAAFLTCSHERALSSCWIFGGFDGPAEFLKAGLSTWTQNWVVGYIY